ncbi:hypothetical protein C5C74_16320, partial [Rathayibacter sp. AY1E8]
PVEGADLDLLEPLTRWLVEEGRRRSAREIVGAAGGAESGRRSGPARASPERHSTASATAVTTARNRSGASRIRRRRRTPASADEAGAATSSHSTRAPSSSARTRHCSTPSTGSRRSSPLPRRS